MDKMNVSRENRIEIIGTLEANNLIKDSSPKIGSYIRGDMVIKVSSPKQMSIPVSYFASAMTKDNKPRKLYGQLEGLRVGQKIGIVGEIRDNKFWDTTRGQLVKTKRLNLTYINTVKVEDQDKADFVFSGFVAESLKEVFDKYQNLTGYALKIGQADYNGNRAQIITFVVDPKNSQAVRYIETNYTGGKTVKVSGLLDYNITTETREEPQDFGPAIVKTFQRSIANLTIAGGVAVEEGIYDKADIDTLLAGEKADDERVMAEAKSSSKDSGKPAVNAPLASTTKVNQSLL